MSNDVIIGLIRRVERLEKMLNRTDVVEQGGGAGGGAPADATYLVLTANGVLSAERVATAGDNIAFTDSGAGNPLEIAVSPQGDSSGLDADTVDGVHLSGLVQTSRQVATGAGLSGGGDLSANLTLELDISDLTEETTPDGDDYVALHDAGSAALRKQKRNDFLSGTTATSASETAQGVIELATQAETDAEMDDTRAVTPLKLANFHPIIHIVNGGHPANPHPTSPDVDNDEFEGDKSIGTHSGGDFWELKSGGSYGSPTTININSTVGNHLYVLKNAANSSTEVALIGNIASLGTDEVYRCETVLTFARGYQLDSYMALRLYDSPSGKYCRIQVLDHPSNGVQILFQYDNGSGLTTGNTITIGYYPFPIAIGLRRYTSGTDAFYRGYFAAGGGAPASAHFTLNDSISQTNMGAKANFLPDEVWLEFSNSSGGILSSWAVDSYRRVE